jgi:hypothetical protein
MTSYPTDIHGPASSAPATTGLVAHCSVCGTQWQVQSEVKLDAKSCPFCGVTDDYGAISITSEKPDFGNAVIYGG